jgi:thiol:disulfide interchange protein
MLKISLALVFLIQIAPVYADILPSLSPELKSISAKEQEHRYIQFNLNIPKNSYVYAYPKGPGIGKDLLLTITASAVKIGSIVIFKPEKYIPDTESAFVWIHKNRTSIFIPVIITGKGSINLKAEGLMCTTSGRCIPFEAAATVSIQIADISSPKSIPNIPAVTLYGNEPSDTKISEKSADAFLDDLLSEKNIHKPSTLSDSSHPIQTYRIRPFNPRFIADEISGLFQAILFGLIAGLILNFMPCVLPVLSLKILSAVSQAQNRTSTVISGAAYTFGVIASFMVLASLAAFAGYSWGALFQRTEFVLAMTLLLFIFALSLFGVFTLNIPGFAGRIASKKTGTTAADSFLKGSVAALLATPCSGPLLGATLAWTLSRPAPTIFAVFISIGIGMALPYLLLTIRPSLAKYIPKPGRWMIVFERIMGFLLAASVVYFLSILKSTLVIPALVMLLIVGVAVWQFGIWGTAEGSRSKRIFSRAVLILLIAAALFVPLHTATMQSADIETKPFSMQLLEVNASKGTITVVDFTADWCPNCRLVERTVLNTDDTKRLLAKYNAVIVKADITQQGTEAEQLLNQLGSKSIPFLAVFPAGSAFSEPVCLRDLYTKKDLKKAFEMVQQ